jgi:hypothetical protein
MNVPDRSQRYTIDRGLSTVVLTLFRFQNMFKIYHWQTPSYARHKASDELVESLSSLSDKLVEGLQGAAGKRVLLGHQTSLTLDDVDDQQAERLLQDFKAWLQVLHRHVELDKGLTNIRDEIISVVDKALYLFTFN